MFQINVKRTRSPGVTLTEILVTIAVISVIASLTMPAWRAITESQKKQSALALVMETLDQARLMAVTGKKEVWLLFEDHGSRGQSSLRIVVREASGYSTYGSKTCLPGGIRFVHGEGDIMDHNAPPEVLQATSGAGTTSSENTGGVMFQGSGRIGLPAQGGNLLSLSLANDKGVAYETIELSRGTGRASCR